MMFDIFCFFNVLTLGLVYLWGLLPLDSCLNLFTDLKMGKKTANTDSTIMSGYFKSLKYGCDLCHHTIIKDNGN